MIGQRTHANQRKGIWRTQGESRDGTYVLAVLYSRYIIQFDHTLRFGWLKIILGIISERLATQNKVTSLPVTPVKERKILNMSMRKCKLCVCVCVCVCVWTHWSMAAAYLPSVPDPLPFFSNQPCLMASWETGNGYTSNKAYVCICESQSYAQILNLNFKI